MSIALSNDGNIYNRNIYVMGSALPPYFYGAMLDRHSITMPNGVVYSTPRVVYAYRQRWGDGEDSLTFFGHKLVSTWRDGEYWEYGFCRHCHLFAHPSSIRSACPYSEF